jgi:cell division protein FtsW (lipid II flippase)
MKNNGGNDVRQWMWAGLSVCLIFLVAFATLWVMYTEIMIKTTLLTIGVLACIGYLLLGKHRGPR